MIELAKINDVKIIYDINYRKNLWSLSQCRIFTQKILKSVDFLFTSSNTLREILEINISYNKDDIFDETKKTVKEFQKVYKIPVVAMTIRKQNKLAALINSKSNNYLSEVYEVNQIDRVGALSLIHI